MPNIEQKEKIRAAYIDYVLTHGERPATVYVFMKELGIAEEDFYIHFSTFDSVDASAWRVSFNHTLEAITTQDVFAGYSSREKILAFYFGLVEHLKTNRSYVTWCFKSTSKLQFNNPPYLTDFKKMFEDFANEVIQQGISSGEIIDRKLISDKYKDALWVQLVFIIHFWIDDNSTEFEKTDEAIEKGVNITFDLMAQSPLDSMVEYGKFLWRNVAFKE
jgi:hypothetical protein